MVRKSTRTASSTTSRRIPSWSGTRCGRRLARRSLWGMLGLTLQCSRQQRSRQRRQHLPASQSLAEAVDPPAPAGNDPACVLNVPRRRNAEGFRKLFIPQHIAQRLLGDAGRQGVAR
jgi:hypothetical protein